MTQISVVRPSLASSLAGTSPEWVDENSITQLIPEPRKPFYRRPGTPRRDTTTNASVEDALFLAPPPETIRAGYPPLSIENRADAIAADLLAHELAPFAGEPGPYLRVIHETLQTIDPTALENIPDRELRARIKRVLVLEMMRDLFADLSDDEIDEARDAARTGDLFR